MPAKSEWRIRKALPEDAEGLERCMHRAYALYQARMDQTRLPPLQTDYAAEIRDFPCWVVEADGVIVAGLVMSFEDAWGSIANVAVDPGFQGRGVGGALMAFAETQAQKRGLAELRLATHVLLVENLAWYRHLGYTCAKYYD